MTYSGLLFRRERARQRERQGVERHNATHLGLLFSFNSVAPSKDLQSLLFKCYFSLTKTITPFINTVVHRQHISHPVMCRVAPGKSMKRQYFILR